MIMDWILLGLAALGAMGGGLTGVGSPSTITLAAEHQPAVFTPGPGVPIDARPLQEQLMTCDASRVGRWTYYYVPALAEAPDQWHLVVLSHVDDQGKTGAAVVWLWWERGEQSQAHEAWIARAGQAAEHVTFAELETRYPRPCDLLGS